VTAEAVVMPAAVAVEEEAVVMLAEEEAVVMLAEAEAVVMPAVAAAGRLAPSRRL
jgi:hypothetical protein